MNSQRIFSFAFKVITTVICLTGTIANIIDATSLISTFSFYTMQSNLFVLCFYIGYIIIGIFNPNIEKTKTYYKLKGAVIMAILLTFVVYNISLQPLDFLMDVRTSSSNILDFTNIFVHFLTPILVFLEYLIFDEKGNFKNSYIPYWCILPALYPIYVYIYASLGGRFFGIGGSSKYAYYFLDFEKIGINGVFGYLLFITVCFIIVSLLLVKLDSFLKKRKKHCK